MTHDTSRRKRVYRAPEIIDLGSAESLTEGSAERKWDGAGSTGWSENWPDATRPSKIAKPGPNSE